MLVLLVYTMPFAGYDDFDSCVSKNSGKEDPKAYCAEIMRNVEGKSKIFTLVSESIEQKSDETGDYIIAYMTTGDLDLVNDIVTKNCMIDMLEQVKGRVVKLDIEHESVRGKSIEEGELNKTIMPAGKVIDYSLDSKGLKVKIKMNPDYKRFDEKGNITQSFEEIKRSIKNGFYDALSIAYVPIKTATTQLKNGISARLLDKINLINVALTGNPVNGKALITDVLMKSRDYVESKEAEVLGMAEKTEAKSEPDFAKMIEGLTEEVKSIKKEISDFKATQVKEEDAKETEDEKKKREEEEAKKKETKSELDALKTSMSEIKALLAKPDYKAMQESKAEMKSMADASASKGPIDYI